ncbi:Helicase associated domain protein [Streptomyces sp. NPDC006173]|uniref:DEAD/DEAH box helicase n=1 Tax=Streptomyces sp. NPDC006173 TaxID=3155349 RepID=UPI0033F98CE8
MARLVLHPHQQEAVTAVTGALAHTERRVTAVSACGTGKTLIAVATACHLAPRGRVLVAVPTLELLTQTVRRWREGGRTGFMVGLSSMSQKSSGLPRHMARLVKRPADLARLVAEQDGLPTTVFVTYASLDAVKQAHILHQLPAWDLIVVDEAHRTCMSSQQGWGTIHDDHAIPARRRLYMTATPRIFTAGLWSGAPTATMDRRDIFGPVVYRLGMAEAIERGLLADYQVVMPVVGDDQLRAILTRKPHLDPQHGGLRAAALQVAVLRAITDHDLQRVLVFHNRIEAAEAFSRDLPDTAAQLNRADLKALCVDGTQRTDERHSQLANFQSADGCAVLSNVRVLAEGIDIPAIDSVVFAAPRNSIVDTIQAIGRALRLVPGRGKKATLVLPVYLPDGRATEQAMHDSQFDGIYTVLQALRAHDDSFLDHIAVPRRSSGLRTGPRRSVHYNRPERALQIALALGLEITLPATGSWHEGLAAATRYHHIHHHLDVPHAFHDSADFALGEWIGNQRLRHLADRLPGEHADALDAIGMLWSTPDHTFTRILDHARSYAEAHGHLAAPATATQGGHPVGAWLAEYRKKDNAHTLTEKQAAQLTSLDPWWNPVWPLTWRRAYAAAKTHMTAGGSPDIPNSFTTPDGFKLGQWLSRQRNGFASLHPEQAQLLIDIGITPHADSLAPEAFRTERGRAFRRGLVAASCYLAREGDLNVPRKHTETDWIGPFRLGSWVDHVRRTPHELTDEERAALGILRMAWNASSPSDDQ